MDRLIGPHTKARTERQLLLSNRCIGILIDDILDLDVPIFRCFHLDRSNRSSERRGLTHVGSDGREGKGHASTYAALVVTAVLVFVVQTIAQDYLMLNEAAGILGGVVLGVSVVTWVYSIIISAAWLNSFLS